VESFANCAQKNADSYDHSYSNQSTEFKSWEFYSNAAEEEVPLYKVELAKSGKYPTFIKVEVNVYKRQKRVKNVLKIHILIKTPSV
jgi:hypothetical protein